MVETQPDPDGTGGDPAPQIVHVYDHVGNETSTIDAMGREWLTFYDAQNRVVETRTPDPDTGSPTIEPLSTTTEYFVDDFRSEVTDPTGVVTITWMDLLGRVTKTKVGALAPIGG